MAMRDFKISKILTDYDIRKKIGLPNRIMEHMIPMMNGSHFLDLKVVDAMAQEWELRYYTRPNGRKKGPLFTAGWPRFVKDKGLRVGDKFTVYGYQVRAADGQLKMEYTIELKRQTITFNGAGPVAMDVERFAFEPVAFEPVNATAIMHFQGQPIIDHD